MADNPDRQNSSLAFAKILHEVMTAQRRKELELYKLYAKDEAFQQAFLIRCGGWFVVQLSRSRLPHGNALAIGS